MKAKTATIVERKTFLVPIAAFDGIKHKVELLNRKARKLGCAEAVLEIVDTIDCSFEYVAPSDFDGLLVTHVDPTRKIRKYEVAINCEPVKLAGWELIGALDRVRPADPNKEIFTVVRPVPDKEIPAEYRDRDHCDHCNKPIARKTTYLVEHEDGRIKQVGGNCLRDFLGQDPERILWYANSTTKIDGYFDDEQFDYSDNGIRPSTVYDAIPFLEEVASVIRVHGWLSKGKAYEKGLNGSATADRAQDRFEVRYNFRAPTKGEKEELQDNPKHFEIIDEDKQQARDAFAWAKEISEDEKNDYLYGLHLVAKHECITLKQIGIAASLISAYAKEQEKELKLQRFAHIKSGHVGEIKKRQEFTVECLSIRTFENDWGCTAQHRLLTDDNYLVVWWASETATWLKEGEHYKVKATVKAHDEYEGKQQTVVNRVAII